MRTRYTERVLARGSTPYLSYQEYAKAWRLGTQAERSRLAQRWAGYEGRRQRETLQRTTTGRTL